MNHFAPRPKLRYTIRAVSIFSKIRGDIHSSRFATGVVDTGGKFAAGVVDTAIPVAICHWRR